MALRVWFATSSECSFYGPHLIHGGDMIHFYTKLVINSSLFLASDLSEPN